jgi:hypothetical protein
MHTTTIVHEHTYGDFVYVRSDPEQHKRQVVEIVARDSGAILYVLQCGMDTSNHYEFELSDHKNYQA